MRVALYARFSSDLQRAASIEDQFRNCRKRADAEGWSIVAEFADEAISGSDNRRPQYLAMLQAAARKDFDILIVDDLSRLTRDNVEQETMMRRLEFQGIRISDLRWLRQPVEIPQDPARIQGPDERDVPRRSARKSAPRS